MQVITRGAGPVVGAALRAAPAFRGDQPSRRVPRVRAEGLGLAGAAPLYAAGRPHG